MKVAAPSVVLWDFLPQPRAHSVSGASLAACSCGLAVFSSSSCAISCLDL